jgi:hypothetical protein
MNFREWLKPRVLISGVVGLALLAFAVNGLLLTKAVVATTCRKSKDTIWIDLDNTSDSFSTPVCVGQDIGWRGAKTFTVTFDKNNKCVAPATYTLDQKNCPGPSTDPPTKCSPKTIVKQPGGLGIGWCDYVVGGGLTDPRVIIIGK